MSHFAKVQWKLDFPTYFVTRVVIPAAEKTLAKEQAEGKGSISISDL